MMNARKIELYQYNEMKHFKLIWFLKKQFLVIVIFPVMYVYINDTTSFQKEELYAKSPFVKSQQVYFRKKQHL